MNNCCTLRDLHNKVQELSAEYGGDMPVQVSFRGELFNPSVQISNAKPDTRYDVYRLAQVGEPNSQPVLILQATE